MLIDARGLSCPKPLTMAEEALLKIAEGKVVIFVDNEDSVNNLKMFADKQGMYAKTIKGNNYWIVRIIKKEKDSANKSSTKTPCLEYPHETEKDDLLIISTDTMGKEEDIGRILMKGFFETMKATKEIPHTIFFLNTGVKLTTANEEIISLLKEISSMGTEIYSCGTCLKYYNLESELKVGHRGTTNHIVEGLKDFKKVLWI